MLLAAAYRSAVVELEVKATGMGPPPVTASFVTGSLTVARSPQIPHLDNMKRSRRYRYTTGPAIAKPAVRGFAVHFSRVVSRTAASPRAKAVVCNVAQSPGPSDSGLSPSCAHLRAIDSWGDRGRLSAHPAEYWVGRGAWEAGRAGERAGRASSRAHARTREASHPRDDELSCGPRIRHLADNSFHDHVVDPTTTYAAP